MFKKYFIPNTNHLDSIKENKWTSYRAPYRFKNFVRLKQYLFFYANFDVVLFFYFLKNGRRINNIIVSRLETNLDLNIYSLKTMLRISEVFQLIYHVDNNNL